ncbi:MAG: penicillin-insensitive murein endopeptidase [Acetobacteraceae bacterium]|nr:MAG: penicillin-insensitive murein endopeptidase [Acetobacteraceae bacterium]
MTFTRILLITLCLAAPAQSESLANKLFGAKSAPSNQDSMPIGSYAKGCGAGLVELPETGPTWQAMRLSRNRNFGQPEMVQFLMDLSATARDIGFGRGLYIGDISQPRGGPMTSGHASHQIGLDADIWMLPPRRLDLSEAEREAISSIPVRSADQRSVTENWTRVHRELMKQAALDPRVDRIFVAAAVKIEMCRTAKARDKKWLQKIRPIAGHDTHFHVRLKCPKGARLCETQSPTVAELSKGGDGCDETLMWWVTDYLDPPKGGTAKPKDDDVPRKKGPREFTMADLPKQCKGVLAAD